jgi:virulence factor
MLRIGIVDGDSGHPVEFTQRLNHVGIGEEQWVDGARVVALAPMPSAINPDRVQWTISQLRDWGIDVVDRPADLVGKVDAVMIESEDGSVHYERAIPFIEAGVPLFVDKPFTTSTSDARRLVQVAQSRGVPLFSASSLRYSDAMQAVQRRRSELGQLHGADAASVAALHPRNPGLFNYAVHAVETLYQLMGPGCQAVRCIWQPDAEVVVGIWADGRIGTVRGIRRGARPFSFTAYCQNEVVHAVVDDSTIYRELLKVVVDFLRTGRSPLNGDQMIEPIAFQEAANLSARRGGEEIRLDQL